MTVSDAPQVKRSWRLTTIIGVLLISTGLGFLGYVGWEYYGTNIVSKRQQAQLSDGLADKWKSSKADKGDKFARGDAIALVRIPRFGKKFEVPLIQGVDQKSLASGIGWFPKTAQPGSVGNFAIAGHRVTHGQPFRDFLKLEKGDKVVVETRTDIFTYVLSDDGTDRVLDFSQTWVLDPVPGKPADTKPTARKITVVTCSELFHTDNRSVVFGELVDAERKSAS